MTSFFEKKQIPMRILMLNNEYPPLGGGQATANKCVADVISKEKLILTDIVTASSDKFHVENISVGNIYYLNIGKKNRNLHYQNIGDLLSYSVRALIKSIQLIRKHKYNYIIAWAGVPSGFLAYVLKILFNISYIVLLRGPDVPFHEKKWQTLDKLFFQHLSPFIWKRASKVIANSVVLRNEALDVAPKQKISVIENGVDVDFWKIEKPKVFPDKTKIILSVGRISKIKGFDLVIQALSKLKETNYEYWIVGDGPEKKNLEDLSRQLSISTHVKFFGIKNKEQLRELYAQASVFCLSSHNEGMSNALLEAMASSLPVVSTDVGGVCELISENGFVVEKANAESLKNAIRKIFESADLYAEMSKKSNDIIQTMTWEIKTEELINEIII